MNHRILALALGLTVAVSTLAVFLVLSGPASEGLRAFRSYSELTAYLDRILGQRYAFTQGGPESPLAGPSAPLPPLGEGAGYSGTNVQVAGIDELDTVKTDGTYLYLAGEQEVSTVRARPAEELRVVARIPLPEGTEEGGPNGSSTRVVGLFVVGDRLVVFGFSGYLYFPYDGAPLLVRPVPDDPDPLAPSGGLERETLVAVYEIEDPSHPELLRTLKVSGGPLTGRLIPPFAYLVVSQPIVRIDGSYALPRTCRQGACALVPVESILYDPAANEASSFTNLLALDVSTGEAKVLSVVTGLTSVVYMSFHALYLTYTKWAAEQAGPTLFPGASESTRVWTTIHKVRVAGTTMEVEAHGDIPGSLLNQFSLDEKDGHLRVFTTIFGWAEGSFRQENGLYVLDSDLRRVGGLEHIAPGEQVHAARFLEDRAYLVTFLKVDPLFVIDVSNPRGPRILGELHIPGYSDYLHPLDGDHLLGIGKETENDTEGDFAWYQGLKLALFNVSDVTNPVQMSRYILGDRGTESEVLWDHKAFLSIPSRNLIVIPVYLALLNASAYPEPLPPWAYGEVVWQGVYVFSVSLPEGIRLHGTVTHQNGPIDPLKGEYLDSRAAIHRSLYIGDVLYIVSPALVKANSLDDLTELGTVAYG